jgi:hypothetical protein
MGGGAKADLSENGREGFRQGWCDVLDKGKWLRTTRKVGDVAISDPIDDPITKT